MKAHFRTTDAAPKRNSPGSLAATEGLLQHKTQLRLSDRRAEQIALRQTATNRLERGHGFNVFDAFSRYVQTERFA